VVFDKKFTICFDICNNWLIGSSEQVASVVSGFILANILSNSEAVR